MWSCYSFCCLLAQSMAFTFDPFCIVLLKKLCRLHFFGCVCHIFRKSNKIAYRKVARSSLSWIVAHFWIFRLIMKGEFDNYVLWPLAQRVQNWIVDRSTCRDFTVFEEWWYIQIQAHIEGINIGLTTWMVSRKIVSWNQKKRVCVSLLIIFGMLLWVYYGFKQN